MEERIKASWETFRRTGNIEAYLLYKSAEDKEGKKDKDNEWQEREREALL